ncbi:endo-beta-N-acetylglucosaminidase H [Brochothrix thermosphacta]|uniref:endo-beta-N-acetylglucosaminidase H n=1 Tax=Brochothrix thermosphacta TaxID=2756 RepID=UPI002713C33B|nr:endo-beta-N-acetylglucosaminidase H [Brochothrix thermosphacta]MDO7863913.1 endo-beta-N-acetylglucosaminidase family protein [Brochothrix thermosphacta]
MKKRTKVFSLLSSYFICITLLTGLMITTTSQQAEASSKVVPKTVMYVEVNDHEFRNVGKYTLANSKKTAIDIGIIFAANINYDKNTKKPYLFLNEQVKKTLNENATQIKPIQARGTKVLLSILGNHQSAGFANFASYESADAFAAELEKVVNAYGLDGIDFDDEYAKYGENGTLQPNNSSFIWLVQALRQRLGDDKLITLYNIGPAAYNSKANDSLSKSIDYSWNPYYGTWSAPSFPGIDSSRLSAAAVEIGVNKAQSAQFAKRSINENYGLFLMYNLSGNNSADFISGITQELYGEKTIYTETVPSVR